MENRTSIFLQIDTLRCHTALWIPWYICLLTPLRERERETERDRERQRERGGRAAFIHLCFRPSQTLCRNYLQRWMISYRRTCIWLFHDNGPRRHDCVFHEYVPKLHLQIYIQRTCSQEMLFFPILSVSTWLQMHICPFFSNDLYDLSSELFSISQHINYC